MDVAIKKGDKRFAFEISVTTDNEHELGNLRKCFRAGFEKVVMVCLEPERLAKLREAVAKQLSPEEQKRVRFSVPDGISDLLIELSAGCVSRDVVSHGRKTRITYRALGEEEASKRREVLVEVSTQSLKKPKKG